MNAIVSVTKDWGIGREGKLLVRNKADMQRFVKLTMGGTVVMGRKTFESFPGGALKGRKNLVITHDKNYAAPGIETVGSVDEARAYIEALEPESVWLIGGQSIYEELLPFCTAAYVTFHETVMPADAFFPNLENDPTWVRAQVEEGGITAAGIPFSYITYTRTKAS
ncbi:MAG: dihydrofolate reductase [Atopobiaceae bacterium]